MPTDVRCLVESDEPYPVVRLVGVLDLMAAESVREALLTCLADRSAAAVVDVSQLRVREPAALSIFSAVAREAAEWPAGQPVLCAPTDESTDTWARAGGLADAEVMVTSSVRDAFARLGESAPPGVHSADLAPAVGAARRARELVTEACARWDRPELAGSGCIAVTEMVNNVVAHAHTPMTVRLALRDGALHAAVRDYSPRRPVFGGPVPPETAGGRGLLLVDTVARRWGSSALDDGKIVWAVLYVEDEPVD
jgi:anti-sigma regulatory factor (Ser/Thr protein kinase)/anti-anti-sigma regulatory factor